ncbi:hypothetical protein [Roseibium sp. RKSG952]|uniref:hypothetical protein n=1 Tax=Roseibium sp. RKSG952 TaxID=2529384 RepID=UPI0012BC7E57|nr:hypothetical protein [Roseibium sp. RKSG952]MTH95924.1 hypothetical protein [Roseibium sp. RKSG952]
MKNADPTTCARVEVITFENLARTDDIVPESDNLYGALFDYLETFSGQLGPRPGERSTTARDEHAAGIILIRCIFNIQHHRRQDLVSERLWDSNS